MTPTLFDGVTYEPRHDAERLAGQLLRVWSAMRDGAWRTPAEIELATGDGWASISARLRDLRKPKFGGMRVERRRRGEAESGVFEYRVVQHGK